MNVEQKSLVTKHLVKDFDIGVNNNLYGGRMLDWLDEAGALFVREQYPNKQFVTLKISETIFHKPVHCNDIISFYVTEYKVGNTSITIKIEVHRNNQIMVTTDMVYVSIDQNGNKISIND